MKGQVDSDSSKQGHGREKQRNISPSSLLLGGNITQTSNGLAPSTPLERIPPITSISQGQQQPIDTFAAPTNSPFSNDLPLLDSAMKSGHHHHTLGQIADKIQEEARALGGLSSKEHDIEYYDDDELDAGDDDNLDGGAANGTESVGRWTKQEHELFLEALRKYGKVSHCTTLRYIINAVHP